MGIQINGQTDTITAIDGGLNVSGADLGSASAGSLNVTGIVTASGFSGNLTGTASTATAAATAYGLSGSPTLSGITSISTANLTVNGNAYPSDGLLSNRNLVINGSMVVNQRGFTGAAGATTNGSYVTDRFAINGSHDGAVSVGQTTLTSTTGGNAYTDGFQSALFFNVTTADASLSASQFQQINQFIEGYNVQGIKKGTANAQPVTLSFWCRSTTTGTYIAALGDYLNSRQVSQAYTINVANTWEKKTLTFPADASGVLNNNNARILDVKWWLAAGSNFTSGILDTSWAAVIAANMAAGQTNLLATTGNNFWLTGVQLEVGTVATPFERRSYGQELALCQRYCQVITPSDIQGANIYHAWTSLSGGGQNGCYTYVVPMRATPTGPSTASVTYTANNTSTQITRNITLNYQANAITYSYSSVNNSSTLLATTYEFFSGTGTNTVIAAEL